MSKTFRFGVMASGARVKTASAWIGLAKRAEELGFSVLTMPDHFGDQLAPVPALAAAAAVTTRLRLGAAVFCNDYKHPVVLAKEAATLDLISGGRFELGLGAGWMKSDYDTSGMPYDSPKVRLDRLEEALQIVSALLAEGPVSFSGAHYQVQNLEGHPKPVQRPHVPLYIGGGGKRMLSIAGRHADIVGINADLRGGVIDQHVMEATSFSAAEQKLQWVREAAGARFDSIELTTGNFFCAITDDREAGASEAGKAFGLPGSVVLQSPHALIGTVQQVVDELQRRRDSLGLSYFTLPAETMEAFAPVVERLTGK